MDFSPVDFGTVSVSCLVLQGGYKVAVIGESFGAESAAVTIGGRLCAPVSPPPPSHILIVCSAPQVGFFSCALCLGLNANVITPPQQGLGVNLPVIVTVGNRSSAFPTPTGATFTYDEPIVNFVSPNPANALGGGTLSEKPDSPSHLYIILRHVRIHSLCSCPRQEFRIR